jgi:hypothetical protein
MLRSVQDEFRLKMLESTASYLYQKQTGHPTEIRHTYISFRQTSTQWWRIAMNVIIRHKTAGPT